MSANASSRADRQETWVMGLAFAGLLLLPLAAWGAVITGRAVLLPSRTPCLETNAFGSCRAYAQAQTMYKRNDWDKDGKLTYAASFPLLNTALDESGQAIQLIDAAFAAAASPASPKHGYCFRDMATIGGAPIDWEKDFALCATPAVYGRTGYRTFIISTTGTTFGKDLEPPTG